MGWLDEVDNQREYSRRDFSMVIDIECGYMRVRWYKERRGLMSVDVIFEIFL